jgi:hypothetical protein
MARRSLRWVAALAALCLGGATAQATVFPYTIVLNGASENPPNDSLGTGDALVVYDDAAHTLSLEVTFGGLTGVTTVAHFHAVTATSGLGGDAAAAAVANVGVASAVPSFPDWPVGVTSGSYSRVFDLTDPASWSPDFLSAQGGVAGAEAAFADALATGRTYLNIHSSFAAGGEIRGFPVLVPEPGAIGLVTLGLCVLGASRRPS